MIIEIEMNLKKTIQIRMKPDLASKLQANAAAKGLSVSAYIRMMMTERIEEDEEKRRQNDGKK